ncbi:uncharacterized protein EI90DRAFT_3293316 [Cantharellus anzutake]|uniref:uncharacterized protein n=1 Tax=Cantharellus anzutake TaxID=1750568 RepID=UPI001903D948|nr:uncharacterized protein EI90DRAFT_3293316 [Cantharellus anzutake]KAF8318282.1 hypothetical protein EI90DRAFT_3293316 [Cantharellus anzutake]
MADFASSASSSCIASGSHNLDGEVFDIQTTVPSLGDGGENSVLIEVIHEVDLLQEEAEHFVQHVERQLKMLRSLIHTNIARFQEWTVNLEDKTWLRARVTYAGCEGGKVMEYLSTNANADRQRLILGISRGLSYLHSNHIVHGNLNPSNVHIGYDVGDKDPIPRINGFGFSYAIRDESVHLKVEGACFVSLRYVPPEILAGDEVPYDRRGDVWSLGCTLSQILLGRRPYEGIRNEYHLLFTVMDPYEWGSPDPFYEAFQRCLAREPSLRPSTSDVVESLELAIASGTNRKLLEVGEHNIMNEFQIGDRFKSNMGTYAAASFTDAINNFAWQNKLSIDWVFYESIGHGPVTLLWTCTCIIGGQSYVGSAFPSRKDAKNDASKMACICLGVVP